VPAAKIWTPEEVQANLSEILDDARNHGPQEIRDSTGVYELKVKLDRTRPDARDFLARRLPKQ